MHLWKSNPYPSDYYNYKYLLFFWVLCYKVDLQFFLLHHHTSAVPIPQKAVHHISTCVNYVKRLHKRTRPMIHKQKGKIIWQMYMINLSVSVVWPNGFVWLLQSTLCCCCCCWQVLYKYLFLLSPGFYLFQRVSPISAREAISLNRWRNGRRYISTSVHPPFCFLPLTLMLLCALAGV